MKIVIFLLSLISTTIFGQQSESIEIIDISKEQLRLMNKYRNEPIEYRNRLLIDSIYLPYKHLWNGYLGNENSFTKWLNNIAFEELDSYNSKAQKIDLSKLEKSFDETIIKMESLTKYTPKGKWYIFFGPKWTDLGGFADGTMLIDLAHESNQTLEDIQSFLPHEINHQIYSYTNKPNENPVLYRIIDEGFACYVSYIYHNKKTSIAEELVYTPDEFQFCVNNENELINLLRDNYKLDDEDLSLDFADRGFKFKKDYPGAIGYYIGFRIIEEYVKRNGENSWKKIYKMTPEKVLKKSKILE